MGGRLHLRWWWGLSYFRELLRMPWALQWENVHKGTFRRVALDRQVTMWGGGGADQGGCVLGLWGGAG